MIGRRDIQPLPGVLDVERTFATVTLRWGALAGLLPWQAMSDWKRDVALVVAADLTDAVCTQLGLRRPSRVIPVEASTVRSAVAAAPAYCVDRELYESLAAAGCRVCRVGYWRGSARFVIETAGGTWTRRRIDGCLFDILQSASTGGGSSSDEWIDRVIRGATAGVLDEAAVRAAVHLARNVDDLLIDAERRTARVQGLCDYRALKEDLADLPGVVESLNPDAPNALRGWMKWEQRLRARVAAGAPTRSEAESVAKALRDGHAPPSVCVAGVGDIPIVRRPGCEVIAPGPDGTHRLTLPAPCWGERDLR